MANNLIEEVEENTIELTAKDEKKLQSLINECGDVKAQKKKVAELEKCLVDDIKTMMGNHNLDDVETDTFIAQYRLTKTPSVNEEGMLDFILTELGNTARELGVVKTKDYIDHDALEKAMYRGDISQEVVKGFKQFDTTKVVPKLNIVKKKGGK